MVVVVTPVGHGSRRRWSHRREDVVDLLEREMGICASTGVSQSWSLLTSAAVLSCCRSAMAQRIRILLLALVVIIVLASVWLLGVSTDRPPVRPPLPNPNGYDDFLKAAALLTDIDFVSALWMDHDGLQTFVSTNSASLRLLRLGLTRQCQLAPESALTNVSEVYSQLRSFSHLRNLLEEEGQLREMENRLADAAQSYVDAINFGNEMSRGGFVLNRNFGALCEKSGCWALAKLVPKLNAGEARRAMTELEKIDRAAVSWDEIGRNEEAFARYEYRFDRHRLGAGFKPISWATTRWERWRLKQYVGMRHRLVVTQVRLLSAELALRCYRADQGRTPTGLAQLVPQYLQQVPSDPFSGRALVYRPQGTNWLLYSVGEDGVDNGGKPLASRYARPGLIRKGDLFFDSP